MKKYIYLLVDEDKNVVAAYENKDVAEKLLEPASKKVKKELVIKMQLLNPDIKIVGL